MKENGEKNLKTDRKRSVLGKLLVSLAALAALLIWSRMPDDKKNRMKQRAGALARTFFDYCVPHEQNGYKPKIFHARTVRHILLIVLLVKVGVVSSLFAVYPNLARLNADVRQEMYRLINDYRVERGAKTLAVNAYLEQTASLKGQDMLANNYFSHFGLDGKKPWQWLDPAQYSFRAMGENLAMDFLTAPAVLKAFQKSPTHDRNLLNTAYDDIGIAILSGELDGHGTNVMVVFFASPKIALEPTRVATEQQPEPIVQTNTQPSKVLGTTTVAVPDTNPTGNPPVQPEEIPVAEESTPDTGRNPLASLTAVPTGTIGLLLAQANDVPPEGISADDGTYFGSIQTGPALSQGSTLQRVVGWSNRFFGALLVSLIALLLINILVKIRVQHASVIANALMLIIVVALAFYMNVHRAEAIGEQVRILSQWIM